MDYAMSPSEKSETDIEMKEMDRYWGVYGDQSSKFDNVKDDDKEPWE